MTKDTEIEERYRDQMQDLARVIDQFLNPSHKPSQGFFLAMYAHGEAGRFNYISNSQRADIIVLLKEMLARFEGQPEVSGRA